MLHLDGSYGEGGGAILRQALALSMHTGKGFKIDNIRANRPKPGLKMQHLTALNTCQRLCNAEVTGNHEGSTEVIFKPENLKSENMEIDMGTAGSITLLLQSLLLPCAFSNNNYKFEIKGGTDVKWSPSIDYFSRVLIPQLKKYADIEIELIRRGYYPKGSGLVKISIKGKGKPKEAILLPRQSQLLQIKGVSHASLELQEREVNERQVKNAEIILGKEVPVNIRQEYVQSSSPGSGLTLWAVFGNDDGIDFENPVILGSDSLGEPSKKAQTVGEEAALSLKKEINSGAAADKYLTDQLIPLLGVAGGVLKTSEITKHSLSNIYVVEKFLDVKFDVEENVISLTV